MKIIQKASLPQNSIVHKVFPNIHYLDSFQLKVPDNCKVETFTSVFLVSNPSWVFKLMSIRNGIVKFFGLKTPPKRRQTNTKIEVGKHVGIFKVYDTNHNEILLGEDDKHLNFRVSIYKEPSNQWISVSTVVHFNNLLGRFYFFAIKPFHKLIVPAILRETVNKLS